MLKSFFKLILISGIYYLLIFIFEKLSKFIFIRDEFMNVNLDYFLFIDTFVSLTLIFFSFIYIRKMSLEIKKIQIDYWYIALILILVVLYMIIEDPLLRIKFITKESIIPEVINFKTHSNLNLIITFINVVILTSVFEELFFRKILLSLFSKKNIIIGVIVSSLIFTIAHVAFLNNPIKLGTLFVFGLISSIIYLRYGLIYSIFFHAGYNLIWYLIKIGLIPYWAILKSLNFGFTYWIIFIVSFFLIGCFISKTIKNVIKNTPSVLGNKLSEKIS